MEDKRNADTFLLNTVIRVKSCPTVAIFQESVARVSTRQQKSIRDISSAKTKLFIRFLKGICCKFHLTFTRDISVCSIQKVQSDKTSVSQ